MQTDRQLRDDDELQSATRRFSRWRKTHLSGTRIPDDLWDLAACLAEAHGASRVARALGLNYQRLKERAALRLASTEPATLGEAPEQVAPQPAPEVTGGTLDFVEFSLSDVASSRGCSIEVQGRDGITLRVNLEGYAPSELDAVLRGVWSTAQCSC